MEYIWIQSGDSWHNCMLLIIRMAVLPTLWDRVKVISSHLFPPVVKKPQLLVFHNILLSQFFATTPLLSPFCDELVTYWVVRKKREQWGGIDLL